MELLRLRQILEGNVTDTVIKESLRNESVSFAPPLSNVDDSLMNTIEPIVSEAQQNGWLILNNNHWMFW